MSEKSKPTLKAGSSEPFARKIVPKPKHDRPIPLRLPFLALVRYYLPPSIYRPVIRTARNASRAWAVNAGDWHWLASNPVPLKSLNRNLWRNAEPSFNYYIMLFLSGVISSLGLLAGSTAAIIGAMIVAPLMGPITGMAFAITMGNRRLLKRSGMSVVTGALLTVMTAYLICELVGLNTLNPEILERTQPTLIDLAIGLAAGAAGAFATTRRDVASALSGVAIAVALVPPLSVIGIGIAFGSQDVVVGSSLLFLTNLAGIILSGGLIFVWQDYGSLRRARRGLLASTVIIAVLGIPLGFSLRRLIVQERARTLVGSIIRSDVSPFEDATIRRLRVDSQGKVMMVRLEVAATGNVSADQVKSTHQILERELARPVNLDISVFPVREFAVEATKPAAAGK
ncbi:MAG: TIGR00341 family protein [Phormidesmis sp.]